MARLPLLGMGGPASVKPIAEMAGIRLWLKADALSGLDEEDPVASWEDSSGQTGAAEQALSWLRPTYRTGVVNGQPVVRFAGGESLEVAALTLGVFTIFSAWRASENGLIYEHSPNINAGAQSGCFLYTDVNSTISTARWGAFSSKNLAANWGSDSAWRVVRHAWNGKHAGHRLFLNGAEQSLATNGPQNADAGLAEVTDTFYLGSRAGTGAFLSGDLAELLVFGRVLSAAESTAVAAYLRNKYGV